MAETMTTPEPTTSAPQDGNGAASGPTIDDIVKSAQERLATITGLEHSTKASAAAITESQTRAGAALAEAQAKLTEITNSATQALTEAQVRLSEITAAATQTAAVKTQVTNEQSAIVESAKVAATAITDAQTRAAAALVDAQAKVTEIATAVTQAVAATTAITDYQAVIATKSAHIQDAQEHADKVRADLDRALTAATQQATDAEGAKARAQSAADTSTRLLTDVRTVKGAAETEAAAVATLRQTAEESTAVAKVLADKALVVESRITDYEKQLAGLIAQSAEQLKTIESLLPGATGAGLAHAFNERRKTFLKPGVWWQWVFVGSVLAIVVLAGTGLWHYYQQMDTATFQDLGRLLLARLPVAAPLLWLALHAGREAALAKRLEEDYGYKAAIASSFEGFQRQMAQFGKGVEPDSALAKLLNDTLTTIAAPPGRIYDGQQLVVSPSDELKDIAKTLGEAAKPIAEAAKTLKPLG